MACRRHDPVTYIAVVRHPLDVALSDRDHGANMRRDRALELRAAVAGPVDPDASQDREPEDPAEYLRWFIDNDEAPTGSGPHGLDDYCQQIRTYWDASDARRTSTCSTTPTCGPIATARCGGWRRRSASRSTRTVGPAFVEAAGLTSMRSRADETAPDAHMGLWVSPERFFRAGGTREWASLLGSEDIAHFEERLRELAGDAADWCLVGRAAFGS